MAKVPPEQTEDWYDILQRPGMNVLATYLANMLNSLRMQLENDRQDTFDKVSAVRGEIRAVRKVINFVKTEYDRAAKGDTPEKKEI